MSTFNLSGTKYNSLHDNEIEKLKNIPNSAIAYVLERNDRDDWGKLISFKSNDLKNWFQLDHKVKIERVLKQQIEAEVVFVQKGQAKNLPATIFVNPSYLFSGERSALTRAKREWLDLNRKGQIVTNQEQIVINLEQADVNQEQADVNQEQADVNQRQADVNQRQAEEIASLNDRVRSLEIEVEQLKKENEQMRINDFQYQDCVNAWEKHSARLQSELDHAIKCNAEYSIRFEEFEARIAKGSSQAAEYRQKTEVYIDKIQSSNEEFVNYAAKLENKCADLDQKNSVLKEKFNKCCEWREQAVPVLRQQRLRIDLLVAERRQEELSF